MSMITEVGWYRGALAEHAVGISTNGYPQFTGKLQAIEKYSFDAKEWSPADAEACEITAFLTLFNKDGEPIFHAKDVMRVFEWDGRSLAELDQADLAGTCVQWEVVSSEYNGETRLKVARIAEYDDVPGTGTIKKLDEAEIKGIDAKFAAALNKLGGGPKPVSAKAPAPAAPVDAKKGKKGRPAALPPKPKKEEAAEPDPTAMSATDAAATENVNTASVGKPTTVPKPPALSKPKATVVELTYEQAWEKCCNMKAASVTDEQLAQAFCKAVQRLCPDKEEEGDITGEEWGKIADTVVAEYGVF